MFVQPPMTQKIGYSGGAVLRRQGQATVILVSKSSLEYINYLAVSPNSPLELHNTTSIYRSASVHNMRMAKA